MMLNKRDSCFGFIIGEILINNRVGVCDVVIDFVIVVIGFCLL